MYTCRNPHRSSFHLDSRFESRPECAQFVEVGLLPYNFARVRDTTTRGRRVVWPDAKLLGSKYSIGASIRMEQWKSSGDGGRWSGREWAGSWSAASGRLARPTPVRADATRAHACRLVRHRLNSSHYPYPIRFPKRGSNGRGPDPGADPQVAPTSSCAALGAS